jgi:hypothetical protein
VKVVGKSIELYISFFPQQELIAPIADVRKSSVTAVSPLALSASRLDRSALGFRQRTERLLADSRCSYIIIPSL